MDKIKSKQQGTDLMKVVVTVTVNKTEHTFIAKGSELNWVAYKLGKTGANIIDDDLSGLDEALVLIAGEITNLTN